MFPIYGHHELLRKLSVFADSSVFAPVAILSAAALWYVTGLLLVAAGIRHASQLVALSILAIPAQFLIVDRQPEISDLLGAIVGFALFAWRSHTRPVTKIEAWSFAAIIVIRGLAPFQFASVSAPFTWIPFGGMLAADWQFAVLVMLEKIFWYTTAVWLLASVMRLGYAIARGGRVARSHRDCAGAPAGQGGRVHRPHPGHPDGLCPPYPFPRNRNTISISRMITTTTSRKNPRPVSNRSTMNW